MPRLALVLPALIATALLTAAAPKPKGPADEPAPAGVAPPADDAVIVGSCKAAGHCVDYEGSFPNGEAQARCKKLKGSWREESCSADGRVGTCTVRDTGSDNRVLTRYYKPAAEKDAKADCKKQPRGVFLSR